jgi:hypothetical protein
VTARVALTLLGFVLGNLFAAAYYENQLYYCQLKRQALVEALFPPVTTYLCEDQTIPGRKCFR